MEGSPPAWFDCVVNVAGPDAADVLRCALRLLALRMKRDRMSALEGAGVLQDRFKKAGKRRCCYCSQPRLVAKLVVPGELLALGAEGAGGHCGRAGRRASKSGAGPEWRGGRGRPGVFPEAGVNCGPGPPGPRGCP
jgi:hypothetical protein